MLFFRKTNCKIVYHSEILNSVHARDAYRAFDSFRFKKIRDQLLREKLIRRKDILHPGRLSDEDLLLVHTQRYIETLKNPMEVGRILNLDYVDPWDDYIFNYFRYLAGGTVLATRHALQQKTTVFNLGGGYHHAHPDRGEGFCLINDVAIAIEILKKENNIGRVLVIDLDYHQGNGTMLIYKNNPDIYTFSMHSENWNEIDKENNINMELPSHIEDDIYLEILKEHLPPVFVNFPPELVIYLAGSDPFVDDTLGDFDVSETGMLERDVFVYRQARDKGIPLAVVAAGGYGTESWKIYYNFIKWVIKNG